MKKINIFTVFGDGLIGRKTADLGNYSSLIKSLSFYIPKSFIITDDIFSSFASQFKTCQTPEQFKKFTCPPVLKTINEALLDQLDIEQAYAVRSSALAERGGTGIYETSFFWVTGERKKDLKNLWQRQRLVYASEISRDAELWRQKMKMPEGMAILIQPVVGKKWGQFFFPSLSGLAYTSYGSKITVRAVVGLGTKAVNGDGALYHGAPTKKEFFDYCRQRKYGDAVRACGSSSYPTTGFRTKRSGLQKELEADFSAFTSLFPKLEELKKEGNFYFEWAIKDGKIYIVQFSPYEEKVPDYLAFDGQNHNLLFSGGDLIAGNNELYSGRASCKLLVYVRDWTKETAMVLNSLNEVTKNYLLIIPDKALSTLADIEGNPFCYRHFSQALAVVEKQRHIPAADRHLCISYGIVLPDHTNGTGASHFAELCERSDILFFGGEFSEDFLQKLPPASDSRANRGILIWKIPSEVIVNKNSGLGQVFIPKEWKPSHSYQANVLRVWADILRVQASRYERIDADFSNSLYDISYAIIPDHDAAQFDPFKVEEEILNDKDKLFQLTRSFQTLCKKQESAGPINSYSWNDSLGDYLNEFRTKLETLLIEK